MKPLGAILAIAATLSVTGCDEEPRPPAAVKPPASNVNPVETLVQQHLERIEKHQREWLEQHDENRMWMPIVSLAGNFVVVALLLVFSYRLVGALRREPTEDAIGEVLAEELLSTAADPPDSDSAKRWG